MELKVLNTKGLESVKVEVIDGTKKAGRAYLYIIKNDLHDRPYGLLEDLYIEEEFRGKGIGKQILKAVIEEAKKYNCYKLTAQSRHERCPVHEFYKKNGMVDYGKNFRIDL